MPVVPFILFLMLIAAGLMFVVPLVIGLYFLRLPASESLWANWRQLAKKYRADFARRGWWRPRPRLRFAYRDARVELTVLRPGRHGQTVLTIRHPLSTPRPGWPTPVARAMQSQLCEAVRPYGVAFDEACGRLEILVGGQVWTHEPLQELVRCGLAIYDQLRLNEAEGIDFLDEPEVQPLESVRCRICGDEIHSDLVFCRHCKTPHHLECWQYNGQCSTYACGETRFVAPAAGVPTAHDPEAGGQP